MLSGHRSLCILLLTVLVATTAGAQNMLANGNFDDDMTSWSLDDGSRMWMPIDANGSSSSGSAQVSGGGYGVDVTLVMSQCVPVNESYNYEFGADILIPSGQSSSANGLIFSRFYSDTECSVYLAQLSSPTAATVDVWTPILMGGTAPASAASVRVILAVGQDYYSEIQTHAVFDEVFLRVFIDPSIPAPDELNVANLDHTEVFFFCDESIKPPLTIYEDYGLWWRNEVYSLPGETGYRYQGYPWGSCTGTPPFDFEFPAPISDWVGVQFTPTGIGTACYRARSWQDDGGKAYSAWSPCCCMDVVEAACTILGKPTVTEVGDTTCGGSTTDTSPELRWSDVIYDEGYRWQVRNAPGTVVDSGETSTNQTFATVDELEPGGYTVRVQARGDGEAYCDGDWSADCPFTVRSVVQNTVDFAWWPEQPKQGERVRFTDLSSDGSVSWHWDFRDGWTSTEQHPAHVFESTGSFSVLLDVEFDSGHLIEEKTITVSGAVQCGDGACEGTETAWSCPADCALEPEESGRAGGSDRRPTMPAAAGGVSGVGGTLWKTQAIVYNPGPEPVSFIVEFTPRNKTWILQKGPFDLEPGRSMYWDNIIEELFNRTGSGGLWVDASAPVLFLTRTYTENPTTKNTASGGTYGEGRYATREMFSLGLGDGEVYLIGLQHDDYFRSNLYFQEVDGSPVTLEVEIFDTSGQRLRRRLVDVDGHSSRLRNLKDLGVDGVHSAYATVEVAEGDGRVAVGGSVIDNITGDPTALDAIHPAQVAKKSASEQHFLVAAIAHTTGTNQSVWRSGLTILNPTSVSQNVTLRYEVEVDRTGVIGEFLEESVTISAGQQLDWKDVLVEFFGAPESAKTQGALHVFSSDSLMVNSRTYNKRSDGGTFGLGLPGLKSGDLISSEGERGIIVGLKNSGGTRTNIGLSEYSGEETEVDILFYTTEQENLFLNRNDPVEPVVPANSHFQLLNIFQRIDSLRDITFQKVKAEVVVRNGGLIYSYATTIDNESGDPTAFTTAKD